MISDEFKTQLKKMFSYHPPKTPEEQAKHESVNKACIDCALSLAEVVKNPAELTTILREIQKVRMLANAAVRYERTGVTYRDLFQSNPNPSKLPE